MTKANLQKFYNLVTGLAEFAAQNKNGDLLQLVSNRLGSRMFFGRDRLSELAEELKNEATSKPKA